MCEHQGGGEPTEDLTPKPASALSVRFSDFLWRALADQRQSGRGNASGQERSMLRGVHGHRPSSESLSAKHPDTYHEKGGRLAPFSGTLDRSDYLFIRRRAQKAKPARPMPRRTRVEGSGTLSLRNATKWESSTWPWPGFKRYATVHQPVDAGGLYS
jgi:hypothetical protein